MTGAATTYAHRLLAQLGLEAIALDGRADPAPLAWRRAGLMAVTGRADGPALVCPAALASAADGVMMALRAIAPDKSWPLNGALLLGERARLLGLTRGGRLSANRSCRLIRVADGEVALNLAREADRDLLPILLADHKADLSDWAAIERAAAGCDSGTLLARGIEMSMAIAAVVPPCPPARLFPILRSARAAPDRPPLVVDLSSLWAGPLCGSLLALAGAQVIKVESRTRLDGARFGHGGFYDLLNADKASVTLDFHDAADRGALAALVAQADIVIEASRPRALRQLGIDRDAEVARGAIWIGITAHDDPDRIGFGDDAAVAGGLAAIMAEGWGEALFAGDAIADPLTGLHAALAALVAWRQGQAGLIALSLAGTTAFACHAGLASPALLRDWQARTQADDAPLYPLRAPVGAAALPGADNDRVLASC